MCGRVIRSHCKNEITTIPIRGIAMNVMYSISAGLSIRYALTTSGPPPRGECSAPQGGGVARVGLVFGHGHS